MVFIDILLKCWCPANTANHEHWNLVCSVSKTFPQISMACDLHLYSNPPSFFSCIARNARGMASVACLFRVSGLCWLIAWSVNPHPWWAASSERKNLFYFFIFVFAYHSRFFHWFWTKLIINNPVFKHLWPASDQNHTLHHTSMNPFVVYRAIIACSYLAVHMDRVIHTCISTCRTICQYRVLLYNKRMCYWAAHSFVVIA